MTINVSVLPGDVKPPIPSSLESKIRQRIDRPVDVQQGGIGVEVGGQFDPTVPHGGLGDAGMDTGDSQVGAEGGAEGMDIDDSATRVILCDPGSVAVCVKDADAGRVVEQ